MEFIKPQVLYGLFALAIPVIIHLFNFRIPKKIVYPDIRFIKQVIEQNKKQRQVKHILLLISRLFFFFFLIVAFAQPILPGKKSGNAIVREVRIFVDNSFSMGGQGKGANLLEEAKTRARQIAADMPKGTSFSLVSNQTESFSNRTLDYLGFVKKLDELKISTGSVSAEEILKKMGPGAGIENWWITDGQKSQFKLEKIPKDTQSNLNIVLLEAESKANCWIDSVWMDEPFARKGQAINFYVRLKGSGNPKLTNFPIQFFVDDIQKGLRNCTLLPDGSITEKFSYIPLDSSSHRLLFKIQDFPISFDDTWFASLKAIERSDIIQIYETSPEPSIEKVLATEKALILEKKQVLNLNFGQIQKKQLVILDGINQMNEGLVAAIENYLQEGGVVFQIPNLANPPSSNQFWFFDKQITPQLTQANQAIPVNKIVLSDGIFKGVFSSLPENVQYPKSKRYLRISNGSIVGYSTVMGLSDGSPFLIKKRVGKGLLFVLCSDLKPENSSLASHSFFVPLMLQLPFQIRKVLPLSFTLGKRSFIQPQADKPSGVVKFRSGNLEFSSGIEQKNGKWGVSLLPEINQAGWYALQDERKITLADLGLNYPRTESEMDYYPRDEWERIGFNMYSKDELTFAKELTETDKGKPLWKWALLMALLFLIFEILLLKWMKD